MQHLINEHLRTFKAKTLNFSNEKNGIFLDKCELPYGPSPLVLEAMIKAANTVNRYPEMGQTSLRSAIANYTHTKKEQIFVGNGSDAIIELLIKLFVQPNDQVLIPIPTFFVYQYYTKIAGGNPIFIHRLDDFSLDVPSFLEKVTSQVKLIFIANPNNPTGNCIPQEVIIQLLENVNCIVVVDECYYEFSQETVVDLVDQYPNLVVLRSFSKSFGLAGLRVGYSIANETIIDYLYRISKPFCVNTIALTAAIVALENMPYVQANVQKICQEKAIMSQKLEQLGCDVYPSSTNFLLVNSKPLNILSKQVVQKLQDQKIFVQDCSLQPGLDEYYFRVSMGTSQENHTFLKAFSHLLHQNKNT
ncbi:MAG: histidinol-phosphate transaminase [Crocosphaera sp.]|nr:histidinol-phosphate transaminase [Crocosphaera sp.]